MSMEVVSNAMSGPIQPLSARRAYYIFLTHLKKCHSAGMKWPIRTVSEFGVGTHLGICFCALLSGAEKYQGFDFLPHLELATQNNMLEELHGYFTGRAPAYNDAGDKAFDFPEELFPGGLLEKSLSHASLLNIKEELSELCKGNISARIVYVAPYERGYTNFRNSTDLILSTATLEHVEKLREIYAIFHEILNDTGYMSHSIDFKSHGFCKSHGGKNLWNAHWLLNDREWAGVTKGKLYSINRMPCSEHLKIIISAGFRNLLINRRTSDNELKWSDLALDFQWMTAEDLGCSGVHVVSVKSL